MAGLTFCALQIPATAAEIATAQTPKTETPESVAARYTRAMQSKNWKASAALMHPDALKQLKKMFRPIVFAAPDLELGKTFFGVKTAAEFDRLSGAQSYERLMAALIKLNPETGLALANSKSQIIGHVLEGENTAHVVYRMTARVRGISITKLGVMPLRKSGHNWRGLLTGDIEGMAAALSGMNAPQTASKSPRKTTIGR